MFGFSDDTDADLFGQLEAAIADNPWSDLNFWEGGLVPEVDCNSGSNSGKLRAAKTDTQKMIVKAIELAEASGDTAKVIFLKHFWQVKNN